LCLPVLAVLWFQRAGWAARALLSWLSWFPGFALESGKAALGGLYRAGRPGCCDEICFAFCRPGGDLLSRVLRRSTIGAGAFHGRVRNGNGCSHPARTTRSAKGKAIFREAGEREAPFEHVLERPFRLSEAKPPQGRTAVGADAPPCPERSARRARQREDRTISCAGSLHMMTIGK
jgi:hypothetical protein